MESYRQDAGYPVLGIVTETVSNPVLVGVAVSYVSVCERSLQSPKKTHSSRNAQLQFFHNRRYAKEREVFEYYNKRFATPSDSFGFPNT